MLRDANAADRKAAALRGEWIGCATYANLPCACRGAMYPGSVANCSRLREHQRALRETAARRA